MLQFCAKSTLREATLRTSRHLLAVNNPQIQQGLNLYYNSALYFFTGWLKTNKLS